MDTLPNQVMRNDGANHGINQPGGNPVTPVIIMVPAPSSNKHSYAKNFPKHPMLELSLIQLLMAVLAIITQVIGLSTERPDAHYSGVGFWCGIFFGASGIFGILSMILVFKIPVIVKEFNLILREPVILNSNQWKRTEVLIAGNVGIR